MELLDTDIHLYFVNPADVSNATLIEQYQGLLNEDEQNRMAKFYRADHRHRFLLTRALIRSTLSHYHDAEPAEWSFNQNPYGKPEIASPAMQPAIRFNISHCDGMIIGGLTRTHDIGVDAEDCRRATAAGLDRLSQYFSNIEINDLKDISKSKYEERFFDYWTLKEAYIKARGKGLAIPLSSFSFLFEGDRLGGFEADTSINPDPQNWQFFRPAISPHVRVAIAINAGKADFTIRAWKSVPLQPKEPVQLQFR